MTVQQLIQQLEKVQNKETQILIRVCEEDKDKGTMFEHHLSVQETFIDQVLLVDEGTIGELNFSIITNTELYF
jgi:hypothetical protein